MSHLFSKAWGHCTLMLRDDNYAIGCAATLYTTPDAYNWFYFSCNYASNNFWGESVYTQGKAGSGCRTGSDSTYKSLCNANENELDL